RYWALVFKARFNLRLILQQQQQNKILFQEFMDRSTQSEDTAQGGQYTHEPTATKDGPQRLLQYMKKFWQRKLSPSEIIIVKDSRSIQVCQGVYGAKADALRLFNRMSMLLARLRSESWMSPRI
ncbi:hypothetical protein IAQ61_010715, partial [Plenodomus lingam]|uniref:uncharacterized protein n=1 Tax=Leptosphaeria maculans TaxID=5022 RepID=UPI00332EF202